MLLFYINFIFKMSFTINEYSIIPKEKRPKLYVEMQTNPYNLEKLNLSKLFSYLDEKKRKNK